MAALRIVPVLDLRDGLIVRATGGDRDRYLPLQSPLTPSPDPGDVARALAKVFGASDLYVADLGAIAGRDPDFDSIASIADAGAALHVDAGLRSADRLSRWLDFARENQFELHPIIGLETLDDPAELPMFYDACRSAGAAFSLDLRDGRPLTRCADWRESTARDIADAAVAAGFERLIVLDLARVGSFDGVGALSLCRQLRDRYPHLSLWAGGGVRGPGDLEAIARAGCDGALVASALHDGRLSPAQVARGAVY